MRKKTGSCSSVSNQRTTKRTVSAPAASRCFCASTELCGCVLEFCEIVTLPARHVRGLPYCFSCTYTAVQVAKLTGLKEAGKENEQHLKETLPLNPQSLCCNSKFVGYSRSRSRSRIGRGRHKEHTQMDGEISMNCDKLRTTKNCQLCKQTRARLLWHHVASDCRSG